MNFEVYDFIMQLFPYHGKVVVGTTYFVGCFCMGSHFLGEFIPPQFWEFIPRLLFRG